MITSHSSTKPFSIGMVLGKIFFRVAAQGNHCKCLWFGIAGKQAPDLGGAELLLTKNRHHPKIKSIHVLLKIAVVCVLILAVGAPRLLALNQFMTADERLWLDRSGKFYYALAHHDFAATFQKGHPGVTVMWTGLVGYLRVDPDYKDNQKGKNQPVSLYALRNSGYDLPLRILVAGREALILINILVLIVSFLFAQRLFGMLPALVGFLLIAFDPFHIALSRILHLDGTLANFMLLSILAFLVYLERRDRLAFLVSAVAAGLAWLTKSPGILLLPLITLLTLFYRLRLKSDRGKANWWNAIITDTKMLVVWGVIAVLVFWLLWPAMWVNPLDSLSRMLTEAMGYAQEGHESAVFFSGKIFPDGQIPDLSFYLISFLWRTTPITLLGLLIIPGLLIQKKLVNRPESGSQRKTYSSFTDSATSEEYMDHTRWLVIVLLLFALGFGVFINLGLKKFDRYIIPCIVPLDLAAGVSLVWLVRWAAQFLREKYKTAFTAIMLLSFLSVQAALAWSAFPYFFSYYNPLFGGSRQAAQVMQIGWGEGLDQAARYLNEKPNADHIRVMAWYGTGSFLYFSKSQVRSLDVDHSWSAADWDVFNQSDYVVTYIHEWQRNLPAEALARLKDMQPEYSVWIDGLEYVRVYKIH